jgi:hypothetical protein
VKLPPLAGIHEGLDAGGQRGNGIVHGRDNLGWHMRREKHEKNRLRCCTGGF